TAGKAAGTLPLHLAAGLRIFLPTGGVFLAVWRCFILAARRYFYRLTALFRLFPLFPLFPLLRFPSCLLPPLTLLPLLPPLPFISVFARLPLFPFRPVPTAAPVPVQTVKKAAAAGDFTDASDDEIARLAPAVPFAPKPSRALPPACPPPLDRSPDRPFRPLPPAPDRPSLPFFLFGRAPTRLTDRSRRRVSTSSKSTVRSATLTRATRTRTSSPMRYTLLVRSPIRACCISS